MIQMMSLLSDGTPTGKVILSFFYHALAIDSDGISYKIIFGSAFSFLGAGPRCRELASYARHFLAE